jgi:hypothetical protein
MCLQISKPRGAKRRVVYKVVRKNIYSKLITPFRQEEVKLKHSLNSDRRQKRVTSEEIADGEINDGIHVYTSKKAALESWVYNSYCKRAFVVKALVDPADWVADGKYNEAVYMKIFMTDEIVD